MGRVRAPVAPDSRRVSHARSANKRRTAEYTPRRDASVADAVPIRRRSAAPLTPAFVTQRARVRRRGHARLGRIAEARRRGRRCSARPPKQPPACWPADCPFRTDPATRLRVPAVRRGLVCATTPRPNPNARIGRSRRALSDRSTTRSGQRSARFSCVSDHAGSRGLLNRAMRSRS